MNHLSNGSVTFLFTDIEGSTQLWEQHPKAMKLALARYDAFYATQLFPWTDLTREHRRSHLACFGIHS